MRRDRRFFAGLVGVAAVVSYLVWTGISDTWMYYMTPSELMARAQALYARSSFDRTTRESARHILQRILDDEPENEDALFMLGDLYYREGRFETATWPAMDTLDSRSSIPLAQVVGPGDPGRTPDRDPADVDGVDVRDPGRRWRERAGRAIDGGARAGLCRLAARDGADRVHPGAGQPPALLAGRLIAWRSLG
jgi:hypothetical protein